MSRTITYGVWLLIVWLALWADVTVANVLSGVLVATTLLVLFPLRGTRTPARLRPLAALRFAAFFLTKLVEASLTVAWEILTPSNRISEGIVAVRLRGVSDTVTVIVANAISLTPGTLTIDVDTSTSTLYVHVLHLRSADAVRREVLEFEAMAAAALAPAGVAVPTGDELPDELGRSQATHQATERDQEGQP